MFLLDDEKVLELELLIYKNSDKFYNINDLIRELGLYSENELDAMEDLDSFINEDEENIYLSDISLKKEQLKEDLKELNSIFNNKFPLYIEGDILQYNNSNKPNKTYLFCLYLAQNGAGQDKDKNITSDDFGKYFEHIVHIVLQKSRPDYKIERLENIHRDLENICKKLRIKFHGLDRCNKNAQDEGVDLIAYRKTHKNALRGHILLIQCAAGKNYLKKDKDCNIDIWGCFLGDLYTHSKMLAIPHIYLSRETHELGGTKLSEAGEIPDRICLFQFIDEKELEKKYKSTYDIIQKYEWI